VENNVNEYIVVNKKLSYKLIEKGYFDSLIKVNGNDYLFENLPEIQDIVDLYGVHMNVINDSLAESLEPLEEVIKTVEPVVEFADTIIEPVTETVVEEVIEPVVSETVIEPVIENNAVIIDDTDEVITVNVKSRRVLNRLISQNFKPLSTIINPHNKKAEFLFEDTEEFNEAFVKILKDLPNYYDKGLSNFERDFICDLLSIKREELVRLGIQNTKTFDVIIEKLRVVDNLKNLKENE